MLGNKFGLASLEEAVYCQVFRICVRGCVSARVCVGEGGGGGVHLFVHVFQYVCACCVCVGVCCVHVRASARESVHVSMKFRLRLGLGQVTVAGQVFVGHHVAQSDHSGRPTGFRWLSGFQVTCGVVGSSQQG